MQTTVMHPSSGKQTRIAGDLLPVVTYSIFHAPLQVCSHQVVLAYIQVSHSCVLQLLTELLPCIHADFKVLASIQSPDAPFLQHLCQFNKLVIKHALQFVTTDNLREFECRKLAIPGQL